MSALPLLNHSMRDADQMLERALAQWGGDEDLWILAMAPDLASRVRLQRTSLGPCAWLAPCSQNVEHHQSWHAPGARPGVRHALWRQLPGMAFRIPRNQGDTVMRKLWLREMLMPSMTRAGCLAARPMVP